MAKRGSINSESVCIVTVYQKIEAFSCQSRRRVEHIDYYSPLLIFNVCFVVSLEKDDPGFY